MSFFYNALLVADIAALKALNSTSLPRRVDGLFLVVADSGDNTSAWYRYKEGASNAEHLPSIVNPVDVTGRWFQFSGGAPADSASVGGEIICPSNCTTGGKAFGFYAPQISLEMEIQVGFDISIMSGATSIQMHRWNQEPNINLNGREFVAELPHTGGTATVTINSTYRWISFFAKNPANSNFFDGVCFVVSGKVCTLMGYS